VWWMLPDSSARTSPRLRTSIRLFVCAPVPFEDLRFPPHPSNVFQVGLVDSFEATIKGPGSGMVTIVRHWRRTQESLIFPSSKFFDLMRGDLKIPPKGKFNLYYESLNQEVETYSLERGGMTSWVPSHGLYLEGCDDSTATLSWKADLQGEYEVASFTYDKGLVLIGDDIRRAHPHR